MKTALPARMSMLMLPLLLAACTSTGGQRISTPALSIQQLEVDSQGQWTVHVRVQNYSNVSMRFDRLELKLDVAEDEAARISSQPGLDVAATSAEILPVTLAPTPAARLHVADTLASGRSIRYQLQGEVSATPDKGKSRNFQIKHDSSLSPAPGLTGVLR